MVEKSTTKDGFNGFRFTLKFTKTSLKKCKIGYEREIIDLVVRVLVLLTASWRNWMAESQ